MTLHAAHGGCKDPDARLAQLAHDPQVDPSGFTRAGTTPGPSGRTHETLATACVASGKYPWPMFSPRGPSVRELAVQALSSVEGGYDLLAPKFDHTPFPDLFHHPA